MITKSKQTNNKQKTLRSSVFPPLHRPFISLGDIGSCYVSCSRPFAQTVLLANVHCLTCCRSGLRSLASGAPSSLDSHRFPLRYSVAAPNHGDSAAMFPQDQLLHTLLKVVEVDASECQHVG